MKTIKSLAILVFGLVFFKATAQQNDPIVVNTDKPVAKISPTMWGVFFEDINFGADGGIYAEMVKNRSFEFAKPLTGWRSIGKKFGMGDLLVINRGASNKSNPRYVHVTLNGVQKGEAGIVNEGFRGMGVKKDLSYAFSIMYRQPSNGLILHVELVDEKNSVLGGGIFKPAESGTEWHSQELTFKASATAAKAKLNIWFEGSGQLDLDMISLFPADTWKGRKGGMRADMIQMLADMKPGFIRFPGGCIVEGTDLANRYQWKNTIGPVEDRQLIINRWNNEFSYKPAPDYFQTFGLGFYEYFQLSEDIGAEPLPILNCGMACQFNSAEVVPLDQLDPYIQDAIDLIEFANSDSTTTWGKVRAKMGHPKPFNLKYMGVGNENWGPQYLERAKLFQQAIKAKYPNINLIYSSGTIPEGDGFHFLNNALRSMKADVIDEHYYRPPAWFLENANRYDSYDRKGAKVFAGEYAAHVTDKSEGKDKNVWHAALAEAAFMTGLERNAAVVHMASYAPLFANTDAWQWAPDLIWVDNLKVFGTPNYFVQKLFSVNKGTHTLGTTVNQQFVSGKNGLYASAVMDSVKREYIVKVVNTDSVAKTKELVLNGTKKIAASGKLTTIAGDLKAKNSFDSPVMISPAEQTINIKNKKINLVLPANSFVVLTIKY